MVLWEEHQDDPLHKQEEKQRVLERLADLGENGVLKKLEQLE